MEAPTPRLQQEQGDGSADHNLDNGGFEIVVQEIHDQHIKITLSSSTSRFKLHLWLVAAQVLFAGFEVLSRVALDEGVGKTAFTFYRNCLAAALLGIYGILVERKNWVHLSLSDLCYLFFLGFLGVTMNQICYLVGLSLTSVMFASAIRNSIPIMTFILACMFKMEKVNLKRRDGRAKLVGAMVGLAGSLVLSLYRGPIVVGSNFSLLRPKSPQAATQVIDNHVEKHTLYFFTKEFHFWMVSWHLGAIFLILSGASFALFLILQAPVLKKYRAPVSFASISCFASVIQLPLVAAAFEPDWMLWKTMSVGEALSILYAGAIGSGIVSGVQSWAVHGGGPVIVAAYQPLETLITACLGFFFLKESLHLGTLLGGMTIVTGLYLLVWGQKLERKLENPGIPNASAAASGVNGIMSFLLGRCLVKQARVKDESEWTEKKIELAD